MASPAGNEVERDQLGKMFELRYQQICTLFDQDREAALDDATELLMEPRLGRLHRAGLHMLLACSHTRSDFVTHALKAVEIYEAILSRTDLSPVQRSEVDELLEDAHEVLENARSDQSAIDREINQKLTSGMTIEELHDAQIKEMNDRFQAEIDEEALREEEEEKKKSAAISSAATEEKVTLRSSQVVPDLTDTSQRTTLIGSSQERQERGDELPYKMDLDFPLSDIVEDDSDISKK
ncbi:hypothetical protein N0V92_003375 [Colletotrichum tropicale]|nr:hypothetical protein N0V92_003375 [Colletotrichum tropicale]